MATVVLQAVGAGIGTMFGGPLGAVLGRAIGAAAGSFIDQKLFGSGKAIEGARLSDLRVMASSEGATVPRLWGRMRVAGQVIWATDFEERRKSESQGGKGGGSNKVKTYSYYANFAVALCEGRIDRIGRIWADGAAFDSSGVTMRLYKGSEAQEPDSLIVAAEGQGNVPAYRGIAYVVFERLPLKEFGNRLPQLSFEVFRGGGGAEEQLRAVTVIPGSTEFGYDTEIVTREVEEGVTESENAHALWGQSDWSVSIDQLTATCGNVAAVSLVVAWFGTDLRCDRCEIRPGVDNADKATEPDTWRVNGVTRSNAHLVSMNGSGPAYGGTPSDASVIRAIQDLKARGLKVMFHPMVLMDIPVGNAKPDPYGSARQASYPWRGRITCSVAPGQPGTPDKTEACAAEIAALVGEAAPRHFHPSEMAVGYSGPAEWSFRRMILHYAKLCALAGGVDAFLLASELRGLTTLRGAGNSFPFVAALTDLAAAVKAILPDARISYGADWTEYGGHRPADGTGDVFFHLDDLWSMPEISFIGINNYMPLSDWRDDDQHKDQSAGSVYNSGYLKGNIAGGEGFDWYYRNTAERERQIRTPITDGAYGKPWVFRVKDLKNWWHNEHFNRPGGIERATPTGWVPQSKPFWFTETGCAAIDKGANQPNAFIDAKSAESLLPYFSRGWRDDLMQNRFVSAVSQYWAAEGSHNPPLPDGGGQMVDPSRIFFWAWDARPFPQFPARQDVWSDAPNYARGHWLNGRIGALPLAAVIAGVAASCGLDEVDCDGVDGLIDGFLIDRITSGRDALEGLMRAFAIDAVESGGRLRFFSRRVGPQVEAAPNTFAEISPDRPLYALTRAQETDLPEAVKISYAESGLDYRLAVVEAQAEGGSSRRDALVELPAAVRQEEAQKRAQVLVREAWAARERAELALPPSFLALEPGDALRLVLDTGPVTVRIEEITDGRFRKIRARRHDAAVYEAAASPARGESAAMPVLYGKPSAVLLDLPLAEGGATKAHAPWIAATAVPWPGALSVSRQTGPAAFADNIELDAPATMGFLTSPLDQGPLHVFDKGMGFTVKLTSGVLASVSVEEVLQGANAAAIGSMEEGWEIIQFARAELVGLDRYRVTSLLRGQSGSEPEMRVERPAGSRFVLLNEAVVQPSLNLTQASLAQTWRIGPLQYDLGRAHRSLTHRAALLGLRPLSPVHARAARRGADVVFSWIRRTRLDGDSWDIGGVALGEERETYLLEIMRGAAVRREVTLSEPSYRYEAADILADFGADPGRFTIRIAQISTVFGPGAALKETLNA